MPASVNSFGAVACGHAQTATTAMQILQQGGNAFDAAIAASLMACVHEPVLASIGGAGFACIMDQSQKPTVLDFFSQSPKRPITAEPDIEKINVAFTKAQQSFYIGHSTVAVPGLLKGLFEIHRRHSTLPFKQLAQPAIDSLKAGVCITATQANVLKLVEPIYTSRQLSQQIYGKKSTPSKVIEAGDTFYNDALADSLESIAHEGEDLFYRGEIARIITTQMRHNGGSLYADDLEDYEAIWRSPTQFQYNDSRVFLNPSPSVSGLLIKAGLARFSEQPQPNVNSLEYYRYIASILKSSDPHELKKSPLVIENLSISQDEKAQLSALFGHHAQAYKGTTHISIADKNNNLIALTLSNGEGCGVITPQTGIMLNNMLGEADVNALAPNGWLCDQRLHSMMCPGIAMSKKRLCAFGSGGSNRIRSAILQFIIQHIIYNQSLEKSIHSARLHYDQGYYFLENNALPFNPDDLNLNPSIFDDLDFFFGGVHGVSLDNSHWQAVSDPRRV